MKKFPSRQKIVDYITAHPSHLTAETNNELYKKFKATTASQKSIIRKAKAQAIKTDNDQPAEISSQNTENHKGRDAYLKSWERLLEITPVAKTSLEERKAIILNYILTLWEMPPTTPLQKEEKKKRQLSESEIKTLKIIIAQFKERKNINIILPEDDYEITPPYKPITYSIEQKMNDDFTMTCRTLNISKRKGIHLALKKFINLYKEG